MPHVEFTAPSHVPEVCRLNTTALAVFNGDKLAILNNRFIQDKYEYEEFLIDGVDVKVSSFYTEKGVNEEWLRTDITSKDVYIPVMGGMGWLPMTLPMLWKIRDKGDVPPPPPHLESRHVAEFGFYFAKVMTQEEKTLAELCCNAHKYHYDFESATFIPHPDPDWNLVKGLLRKFSVMLSGGIDERLADYGRLLLFLLSKVTLSDDEKILLEPIFEFVPSSDQLENVIKREALIQKFVSEAKKDPSAFLLWGENWGQFWWQTAGEQYA